MKRPHGDSQPAKKAMKHSGRQASSSLTLSRPSNFGMARYESHRREIKYCDSTVGTQGLKNFATPPVALFIQMPLQGAAPYQRVGQRIMLKSLRLRGFIENLQTGISDVGRVIVIYDRQTNGASPIWSDLILATVANGTTSSDALDGINMNNRERFKVLCDEQIYLPAVTNVGGVGSLTNAGTMFDNNSGAKHNFDRFIPLKDLETHFKATAGGVGDVATGGLFAFFVCEETADNTWAWRGGFRLRYDDI